MKADVTIPDCACGGKRLRVSTQPVYRCPDCGDTIHRSKGEWKTRSAESSFSDRRNPSARHVTYPTVGLAARAARPPKSKFYLDHPYRRTASGKAL